MNRFSIVGVVYTEIDNRQGISYLDFHPTSDNHFPCSFRFNVFVFVEARAPITNVYTVCFKKLSFDR